MTLYSAEWEVPSPTEARVLRLPVAPHLLIGLLDDDPESRYAETQEEEQRHE